MIRKTFSIYGADILNGDLFAEVGKSHCAFWVKAPGEKAIISFEFFQFNIKDDAEYEEVLKNVKDQSALVKSGGKLSVIYNTEECICVPSEFSNESFNTACLQTLFGNLPSPFFYHQSKLDNLHIASAIPKQLHNAVNNVLNPTLEVHEFLMMVNDLERETASENVSKIKLWIYTDHYIIGVREGEKLQLVQKRKYAAPDDVLYYLLNVCKQYGFNVQETEIEACGMLDKQSSLYEMLHKYFLGFKIEEVPPGRFDETVFHEFPLHFFLPFSKYQV